MRKLVVALMILLGSLASACTYGIDYFYMRTEPMQHNEDDWCHTDIRYNTPWDGEEWCIVLKAEYPTVTP